LPEEITIRAALPTDFPAVECLLESADLPSEDCQQHLSNFLIAEVQGQVIGVGGLQVCGGEGLIRSLAVSRDYRDRGLGRELYARVLERARKLGIEDLYLLTDSAAVYFRKLGFDRIERADTPATIASTRQFTELCPQSATVMFQCLKKGGTQDSGRLT
jgi:N-acetylglutamate synthase-like GNAT family acetyltransferase